LRERQQLSTNRRRGRRETRMTTFTRRLSLIRFNNIRSFTADQSQLFHSSRTNSRDWPVL